MLNVGLLVGAQEMSMEVITVEGQNELPLKDNPFSKAAQRPPLAACSLHQKGPLRSYFAI